MPPKDKGLTTVFIVLKITTLHINYLSRSGMEELVLEDISSKKEIQIHTQILYSYVKIHVQKMLTAERPNEERSMNKLKPEVLVAKKVKDSK